MKHGYSKLGTESAPDTYRTRYSSDSPSIRIECGQRRIRFGQRKFDRTRVRSTRGCDWDSFWIRFSRFFFWIFPSTFGPGLQVNMGESSMEILPILDFASFSLDEPSMEIILFTEEEDVDGANETTS